MMYHRCAQSSAQPGKPNERFPISNRALRCPASAMGARIARRCPLCAGMCHWHGAGPCAGAVVGGSMNWHPIDSDEWWDEYDPDEDDPDEGS